MTFLPLTDLYAAKELGADIVNRTFPENIPQGWYDVFRNAGWTPVRAAPDAEAVQAEETARRERDALNARIDAMSQSEFMALREDGWNPGDPIPGDEPSAPAE